MKTKPADRQASITYSRGEVITLKIDELVNLIDSNIKAMMAMKKELSQIQIEQERLSVEAMNDIRLTREEAAEYLGCGMSSLYELEKSGQLNGTFYNIGRRRVYIKSELYKWRLKGGQKDIFLVAENL